MPKFIREVFSENNGFGSFGRVASAFTVAAAIFCLCYHTIVAKHLPDAATAAGLASFAVGPYTANKVATAAGKFADGNGDHK